MRWTRYDVPNRYTSDYVLRGKRLGIRAEVIYSEFTNDYHFKLCKDDKVYDSLWKRNAFKTEDGCRRACEAYIDKVAKQW